MLNRRIIFVILAASLLSSCASTYSFNTISKPTQLSQEIIVKKINEVRKANNRAPLKFNQKLYLAAQAQSDLMAKEGKLSHELGGSLRQRVNKAGYKGAVGENLAGGYDSLEAVINGWLASNAHRATLLNNKFSEFGLAYTKAEKGQYKTYWTFIAGGDFSNWF